jgi:hypothetical protein
MQHRLGSRRALADRRQAAKGGRRGRRRQMECDCGASFTYQPGGSTPIRCPACADTTTIYDRDRGLGRLPANLTHYVE